MTAQCYIFTLRVKIYFHIFCMNLPTNFSLGGPSINDVMLPKRRDTVLVLWDLGLNQSNAPAKTWGQIFVFLVQNYFVGLTREVLTFYFRIDYFAKYWKCQSSHESPSSLRPPSHKLLSISISSMKYKTKFCTLFKSSF